MEDHVLDLVIGEGPSARSIRIDLAPFTLVAATTRAGMLATPLRDRFGIPIRLEFYTHAELQHVLLGAARKMGAPLSEDGAAEIAARARGTPRVAGRLLRRVRDFAEADGATVIDRKAAGSLARLEVDEVGLDSLDRRYLRALIEHYGGGPAGVETIAYAIAEARDAVEDVIEPYLMQQGFIQRTPRGRVACGKACTSACVRRRPMRAIRLLAAVQLIAAAGAGRNALIVQSLAMRFWRKAGGPACALALVWTLMTGLTLEGARRWLAIGPSREVSRIARADRRRPHPGLGPGGRRGDADRAAASGRPEALRRGGSRARSAGRA
jgi:hypothetical protein